MAEKNQSVGDRERAKESPAVEELNDEDLEQVAGGAAQPRGVSGRTTSNLGSRRVSGFDGKGNDVITEELD